MAIGYIYLTTNLINNRKYIGKRQSSTFDESYKGSGKILKQAILKEGWDNFSCEVLEWCSTVEELNQKEKYYIELYDAVNSNEFYNIACGGTGGNTGVDYAYIATLNRQTEETRRKRGESLKKAYEEGRHPVVRAGYPKGKKRTEEDRLANVERNKNRVWVKKDGIEKTIDKSMLDEYLSNGWERGRIISPIPWNKGLKLK